MTSMTMPTAKRARIHKRVRTEKAERHLLEFIKQAWPIIEPSTPFIDGWHIGAICEHLEAMILGQIRNLLVTVPPRCCKSSIVSVFWPAWVWINKPGHRWIYASYAADLAIRDSRRCRQVIESQWYKARWGSRFNLIGDQNVKSRFENNRTGYRIASSVGGSITGEGGDTIVADDPHNLRKIHSPTDRQTVRDWWDEVMSTRLNDPKRSGRVIISQRGHEEDLPGHIIDRGGYVHLNLPMGDKEECQTTITLPISGTKITRQPGQLLWPERFDQDAVDNLRVQLGSYAASAQLDQRPSPKGGGIFKRKWWRFYKELPKDLGLPVQSWDTGYKEQERNDPSVCITGAEGASGFYLLDLWRDRVDFPDLKRAAIAQNAKHAPTIVLVEDKVSGISLIQSLRGETKLPVHPVGVDSDKITRACAVSPTVEAGNVWLPEDAPWVADFMDEFDGFPNAAHDDQVDALSQLLSYFLGFVRNKPQTPQIVSL